MPSKSAAQRKLMAIAAHTKGGYGGVPQSVGKDFHEADMAYAKTPQVAGIPRPPKSPMTKLKGKLQVSIRKAKAVKKVGGY